MLFNILYSQQIQFGVFSSSDISKLSTIECVNRDLYDEHKQPVPYGPIDLKLGVNQKNYVCHTCGKKIDLCPGHFGYIRLHLPIFHIGFFKAIIDILRCICKNCGRILLRDEDKEKYRPILRKKKLSSLKRKGLFKEICDLCRKVKICQYCGAYNGTVKHIPGTDATIIIHEINKNDMIDSLKIKYDSAMLLFKEMENSLNNQNNKFSEELTSNKVYELFKKIPKDDIVFFDMDIENAEPVDLLLQYVLVPPLPIRPTVQMGTSATNEDDLTIKIKEMIHLNKYIKMNINEGHGNTYKLIEDLNLLQSTHAYYINSDTKGINKNIVGNKPIRSLTTRLKGKTGRFRGNLSGKRVDFTGRTVISPDPNLQIDQVGVPELMAKLLTYPEKVTETNINELKKLILNGPTVHPGALYVTSGENRVHLAYTNRKKVCDELKIGDIVERHMLNRDVILFNRQPSLHRLSIMAFHVKVLPWRTLRFNESVCTPFNADFDGDEMNIHLPQTEEARAEALHLMGVLENMQTPKNAEPLIASTQDFLTTFYLVTQKDFFLDRTHFFEYISYFGDANERIDVPPPTIFKPKELWTGKQLFSLLLRPNRKSKVVINLDAKARNFSRKFKTDEFRCPNDGFVIIRNSELLCGNIDKATIGNGSKNGIVFALLKDNNKKICAKVLTRISKFSARWITNYGMSFGISDVIPRADLIEQKEKLVDESYRASDEQIALYNDGKIQLKPGLNAEQSLESALNGILSEVRETIGGYLRSILPKSNSALIMAVCGSKGSDINLCQMIACLGQQIVNGNRMSNGFTNRTLPHFEEYSKYPAAKGFVRHSFYDGLSATEFFFHTVGGREGLVDTAVKTAETGYMQRRLMKALEDITVQYNNVVTISSGEIIQFIYGDDGIDPMCTDTGDKIVYLPRLMNLIKSFYPKHRNDEVLTEEQIEKIVDDEISKTPIHPLSENFINDIKSFFDEKIKLIRTSKADIKIENLYNGICCFTYSQIRNFFRILWIKLMKARVSPGEAVGAVAGQSIGEPGTQMTLKTFHFAGVASMNITLGVPRIKEIINFTKNISTPVIFAKLVQENDVTAAKIVKGRIETIKLSKIVSYIKEVISTKGCYLKVKLDKEAIDKNKLEITIEQVKDALLANKKKLKLKDKNIIIENNLKLKIEPPDSNRDNMYFSLQTIKKNLPDIIISGVKTVHRVVINKKKGDESKYILAIEGTGLNEVMKTPGIDYKSCTSNNIDEINNVLGIEAARATIIYELNYTFSGHSIQVDKRHLNLIADLMTFKGSVYGFQRFGMAKMKDSVLLHSSFERTSDVLFDSAMHAKVDKLKGVTESIITGKMMPVGTGLFRTFYDRKTYDRLVREKESMMDVIEEEDGKSFGNNVQFNIVDMIK